MDLLGQKMRRRFPLRKNCFLYNFCILQEFCALFFWACCSGFFRETTFIAQFLWRFLWNKMISFRTANFLLCPSNSCLPRKKCEKLIRHFLLPKRIAYWLNFATALENRPKRMIAKWTLESKKSKPKITKYLSNTQNQFKFKLP